MTETIQTIYLLSSFIGVCAMVPQIRQLIATRQSDELSLTTWMTWGCCQLVSFMYAISIHATAYMIVNVAWITFYAVMVYLIIKYRKKRNVFAMLSDALRRKKAAGSFW